MKIVFNEDTKRFQDFDDYSTLVSETARAFGFP